MLKLIKLTCILLLCLSSFSWSADKVVVVPLSSNVNKAYPSKTGLKNCFNASGSEISCTGSGQDGEYQKGIANPTTRFTDNGDGTVTDNLTSLIWLKDANCMDNNYEGVDSDGWVFWEDALAFIAGINSGLYPLCGSGHNDWRLPNIKELLSLVDYGNSVPALPSGHPFTSVEYFYWSSTTYTPSGNTNAAWYIEMVDGSIYGGNGIKTTEDYPVWPVRGGR